MKKKILFLCSDMGIGGFQKSLVSLLQYFDFNKYDVDLLLFSAEGIFIPLIPKEVNIVQPSITPEFLSNTENSLKALWKSKKIGLLIWRLISSAGFAVDKGLGAWLLSRAIPKIKGHYDAAIDYNGQHILYYMADKVSADKKITYFHNDYRKWDYYKRADKAYFKKADAIVSVSDKCVSSLKEYFPENAHKMYCVENIIADKTVNIFPESSNGFTDGYKGKRIVTVGRLCEDKGADIAIDTARILKQRDNEFRWYWVGPCGDFSVWQEKIGEYGLEEDFILLGGTNNPYDYMRNAYIIAHPSRFEGKAVAVEEAKVLGIPVVATNYSTVINQITDGLEGSITEMNVEAFSEKIEFYLKNPDYREERHKYMLEACIGNETEVEKVYELIEG